MRAIPITYKFKSIWITEYFSAETPKARRILNDVLWTQKETECHPKLLYPEKLPFRIKGKIKVYQDKHKLKKFMTTQLVLQRILKWILYPEGEAKLTITGAGEEIPWEKEMGKGELGKN